MIFKALIYEQGKQKEGYLNNIGGTRGDVIQLKNKAAYLLIVLICL